MENYDKCELLDNLKADLRNMKENRQENYDYRKKLGYFMKEPNELKRRIRELERMTRILKEKKILQLPLRG